MANQLLLMKPKVPSNELYQKIHIYYGKTNEELVKTRMKMKKCNTMKTKTKQTILSDPHRLKEYIKRANLRAYYWQQYLEYDIKKIKPSRAAWSRDETIKTILV